MVNPAWREELKEQLVRQGLPPPYIERLVQELTDHFTDVLEEGTGMAAERVGQPSKLAAAAGAEHHKGAFSRRHPVLVFAALPVLLLPLLWVVFGAVVFVAVFALSGGTDVSLSFSHLRLVSHLTTAVLLVPPATLAVLVARFARRRRMGWRWPLVSTGLLAVLAGLVFSTVIPWGPGREPRLALCVGLPLTFQQLVQSVLILLLGGWCCWPKRRSGVVV